MSDLAYRAMTLDEFLRWDDGTDTHYELIGGFPVAMAPPAAAHRILAMRLGLARSTPRWQAAGHAMRRSMPA